MKIIASSLLVIVVAGTTGLALSTGHAMLTPEPTWTTPGLSVGAGAGMADDASDLRDVDRVSPVSVQVSSVMPTADGTEPGDPTRALTLAKAAPVAGAIGTSPRPRPRSDAFGAGPAQGADIAADTAVADMSFGGDTTQGVAFGHADPRDGDGFGPTSVSMASVMSKAPMMAAPVPGYLHGVFR